MTQFGKYYSKKAFFLFLVLCLPTILLGQITSNSFQATNIHLLSFGAFYGISFFMLGVSLIRFFYFKDKAYLCYGLYILFNLIFFVFWYGLFNPSFSFHFTERFPFASRLIFQTALFLGYAIYYFFIIKFFKLWAKDKRIAVALQRIGFVYLSFIAFDLISLGLVHIGVLPQDIYNSLRTLILIGAVITGMIGFYYAFQIKDKLIGIILTGAILYFIGSTCGFIVEDLLSIENENHVLAAFPLLPTQIGFLLEIIVFSFGLSYRIIMLEKDHNATNEKLIQQLTTNQQLELEKLEAQRLTEITELKTKLYTNITHEFKSPLTIINGIANDYANEEDKALIQSNSTYLLELVNQILDLAKIDSGELSPQYVQANIIIYLNYLVESHISLANTQEKNLSFYSEVEELVMDYDPKMIRQIVSNLLSNALKFTDAYGKIQFIAKNQKGKLILQIKDSGIGIPPEHIPHIFDHFYQVDNNKSVGGSGIGLALVKNLVKVLHGDIEVESTLGKNTIFTIQLPITNKAPIQDLNLTDIPSSLEIVPPLAKTQPIISKEKSSSFSKLPEVVIIEDNEDMTTYLELLFKNYFRTHTVRNGKEGIQKVKEIVPDAIICDVMMPQMDGYQVCRAIRKDLNICHIPIILLSARASTDSKLPGLQAGADAYLQKPFDREELLIRVQLLVKNRDLLKQFYTKNTNILGVSSKEDQFLQTFFEIVENNYADPDFALPQLCQKIHLERTQVYRRVKKLTDKGPSQLIKSYRLKKAKELSLETNLPIEQIAKKVGYKNPTYFLKSYQEEFGHPINATNKTL